MNLNWYYWLTTIFVVITSIYNISIAVSSLKKAQKRVDKFKHIFIICITATTLVLVLYLFYLIRTLNT